MNQCVKSAFVIDPRATPTASTLNQGAAPLAS